MGKIHFPPIWQNIWLSTDILRMHHSSYTLFANWKCEIFGNIHSFQALKEDQSWDQFENVCHHCQWSSPPRAAEQRHFIMADGGHVTRDTRDHCCVRGPQWEYDNLIKWSTMSRSISNWIVNCATYNLVHTSRGIKWISVKLLNTTYSSFMRIQ